MSRLHVEPEHRDEPHRESHERIAPELDRAIRLERLYHLHAYKIVDQ